MKGTTALLKTWKGPKPARAEKLFGNFYSNDFRDLVRLSECRMLPKTAMFAY